MNAVAVQLCASCIYFDIAYDVCSLYKHVLMYILCLCNNVLLYVVHVMMYVMLVLNIN